MDVDSKCPVPTEDYFLKQTKVPYRRVEFCSNTKLQGANLNLAKWEKSHGVVLKYESDRQTDRQKERRKHI